MKTLVIALSPELVGELLWVAAMLLIDYAAVVAAILIDLRSGVLKARREGKRLTSRGYRRTVEKASRYLVTLLSLTVVDSVVIVAAMLFRATMGWSVPVFPLFSTLGAIALALIEGKSVMENTQRKADFAEAADKAADLLTMDELRRLIEALKSLKD